MNSLMAMAAASSWHWCRPQRSGLRAQRRAGRPGGGLCGVGRHASDRRARDRRRRRRYFRLMFQSRTTAGKSTTCWESGRCTGFADYGAASREEFRKKGLGGMAASLFMLAAFRDPPRASESPWPAALRSTAGSRRRSAFASAGSRSSTAPTSPSTTSRPRRSAKNNSGQGRNTRVITPLARESLPFPFAAGGSARRARSRG